MLWIKTILHTVLIGLLLICINGYKSSFILSRYARILKNHYHHTFIYSSSNYNGCDEFTKVPFPGFSFAKGSALAVLGLQIVLNSPLISFAEEKLSLNQCFQVIQTEIDGRKSLDRLKNGIDEGKWDDVKQFTREYEAGVRGSIMKSAWKQMNGDKKRLGIERSNSFTFDLIGVNKAARKGDKEEALKYLGLVEQDLQDFADLKGLPDN